MLLFKAEIFWCYHQIYHIPNGVSTKTYSDYFDKSKVLPIALPFELAYAQPSAKLLLLLLLLLLTNGDLALY